MNHPIQTQTPRLASGDTIIVTCDRAMSSESADALRQYVLKQLPAGVYAVVLGISVALVVQALLALFYRIETNGRSLEAIAVAEGAPAVRPG